MAPRWVQVVCALAKLSQTKLCMSGIIADTQLDDAAQDTWQLANCQPKAASKPPTPGRMPPCNPFAL